MTIKTKISVDKENKVLTLLVTVPRKKFARDENLTYSGNDAWDAVKNYGVSGYKVIKKVSGLVVDNWRVCNHVGEYSFLLEEDKPAVKKVLKEKEKNQPSPVKTSAVAEKKPLKSTRKDKSKKN